MTALNPQRKGLAAIIADAHDRKASTPSTDFVVALNQLGERMNQALVEHMCEDSLQHGPEGMIELMLAAKGACEYLLK